jgi:hypothetical protein
LPPKTGPGDGPSTPSALFHFTFFSLSPLTGLGYQHRSATPVVSDPRSLWHEGQVSFSTVNLSQLLIGLLSSVLEQPRAVSLARNPGPLASAVAVTARPPGTWPQPQRPSEAEAVAEAGAPSVTPRSESPPESTSSGPWGYPRLRLALRLPHWHWQALIIMVTV